MSVPLGLSVVHVSSVKMASSSVIDNEHASFDCVRAILHLSSGCLANWIWMHSLGLHSNAIFASVVKMHVAVHVHPWIATGMMQGGRCCEVCVTQRGTQGISVAGPQPASRGVSKQ